jgi:hypothetical protein
VLDSNEWNNAAKKLDAVRTAAGKAPLMKNWDEKQANKQTKLANALKNAKNNGTNLAHTDILNISEDALEKNQAKRASDNARYQQTKKDDPAKHKEKLLRDSKNEQERRKKDPEKYKEKLLEDSKKRQKRREDDPEGYQAKLLRERENKQKRREDEKKKSRQND